MSDTSVLDPELEAYPVTARPFLRAYNAEGTSRESAVAVDQIKTVFVRSKAHETREGKARRGGYHVQVSIAAAYDGPTYSVAIVDDRAAANALKDELLAALAEGQAEGVCVLDEAVGFYCEADEDDPAT